MTQQCKHWLVYSFIALLAACGSQEGVNTYEAGVNNALPATKAAANSTVSPAENNANASTRSVPLRDNVKPPDKVVPNIATRRSFSSSNCRKSIRMSSWWVPQRPTKDIQANLVHD